METETLTDKEIRKQRSKKKVQIALKEKPRKQLQAKIEDDKLIVRRAINKAIDNGWDYMDKLEFVLNSNVVSRAEGLESGEYEKYAQYIFRHDFAKVLWGEDEAGIEDFYSPKHSELSGSSWPKMWEYHLREMVIDPDPIKYLGENI